MNHRISKQKLQQLNQELSSAAKIVMDFLHQHRFATTKHIARLLRPNFASESSAIRQTARLMKHLASSSLVAHLKRRIGGARAGSTSSIWHLTEAGQRFIYLTQTGHTSQVKRLRIAEPSWAFLAHTLAITELRILTEETCRQHPITITTIETEPNCWRSHLGHTGQPEWVKPNLALITRAGGFHDHWWCEVDLATERPARIHRKTDTYLRHLYCGTEQTKRGTFPVVVWLTPTPERSHQLRNLFTNTPDLPPGMFEVMELTTWAERLARTVD